MHLLHTDPLEFFTSPTANTTLAINDTATPVEGVASAEDCAWRCISDDDHIGCQAFEYLEGEEKCMLRSNTSTFGGVDTLDSYPWDYYEIGK